MNLPPVLPFPDLVSPRVIGSRAVVSDIFSPTGARGDQGIDNEYAGEEGNWRAFKQRLTSQTTGPRVRAVLDKAPFEPEAALPKLPPLLAKRRQRNRTRPWREAPLQRELSYNQVNLTAPARLPALSQAQPEHGSRFMTAAHFRQPAPPDVLPPDEAFRLLLEDKAAARRQRIPEPVWMHGRAYRMDDMHQREESVRGGGQQQAPVGPISSRWQGSRGGRRRDKRVLGANFVGG